MAAVSIVLGIGSQGSFMARVREIFNFVSCANKELHSKSQLLLVRGRLNLLLRPLGSNGGPGGT